MAPLEQSPQFNSPTPIVSGGWLFAVRFLTAVQSPVRFNTLAIEEPVASVLSTYSESYGVSGRVGTAIAVSVQEHRVVAVLDKTKGGLFETLVPGARQMRIGSCNAVPSSQRLDEVAGAATARA